VNGMTGKGGGGKSATKVIGRVKVTRQKIASLPGQNDHRLLIEIDKMTLLFAYIVTQSNSIVKSPSNAFTSSSLSPVSLHPHTFYTQSISLMYSLLVFIFLSHYQILIISCMHRCLHSLSTQCHLIWHVPLTYHCHNFIPLF